VKKYAKVVYIIKMVLFVIHFYFVFMMLHNILDATIYGVIFLAFYLVFAIKVLSELLSKKDRYKNDLIYNIMQIGVYFYLMIVSIKTYIAKIYVTRMSLGYFRINYLILTVLIIFIFVYSYLEFKSSKK
jgi:hypothetical protein